MNVCAVLMQLMQIIIVYNVQLLSIIGGMLTGESLLIAWDLSWDSFAVRPTGQVQYTVQKYSRYIQ